MNKGSNVKTQSIEVSTSLLTSALSQLTHQNTIMTKESTNKDGTVFVRETLEVARSNFGPVVKITIGREEVKLEPATSAEQK